ncbi:hypothetical protein L226DRAFT_609758 [Lentinus tigrinus ALCF2SS1-7]|uniref:Uncharacterized protein n=1 Tax=Lentinus tigrinus ALCF2SS1-6 TaxID=1328759 RepID=A0A5C2SQH1_9APHY|nr:hypothetical protein L227DRAFT_597854 [Lentinus tigrinus ALCF2SS1-6]RPD79252.1 hypothetical protein L226DRAFT_609758 [Lentinus tigrinus ALCF2SS1-7]
MMSSDEPSCLRLGVPSETAKERTNSPAPSPSTGGAVDGDASGANPAGLHCQDADATPMAGEPAAETLTATIFDSQSQAVAVVDRFDGNLNDDENYDDEEDSDDWFRAKGPPTSSNQAPSLNRPRERHAEHTIHAQSDWRLDSHGVYGMAAHRHGPGCEEDEEPGHRHT